MQLNDKDLDKKLEDLDKQRKKLYEIATMTDKKKEKEKYLKIKEDLKQNQKDIALFTIEKENRDVKINYDYDKEIKQLKIQRKELLKLAENTDKEKEKEAYKQLKKDLNQNKLLIEEAQQKKEREKEAKDNEAAKKEEQDNEAAKKEEQEKEAAKKEEQEKKEEIDYDKEIKQLKIQRKELLKLAENTDKEKEKEAYKQLKKDLNQNKLLLEEVQEKKDQQRKQKEQGAVVEDIDYDKQLQDLEKRQEELNETKRKTNKTKDPEKYNRIKEEINKNQKNIVLLTLEKENQEKNRERKGEEGQKEEGTKEEGQQDVKRVLMQLQLGDVILLQDSTNLEFNGSRFFINYIDDFKIKLINLSSMTSNTLKINKDKTIEDDTIDLISLLFRNKTPSYARQNKLLPGIWININFLFENDVPKIETGEITNLEEDMIEIKLFPSNTIIYLNFEYKGMPDNVTIEIRDKIVKKSIVEATQIEEAIEIKEGQDQEDVPVDEVENEEGKKEKEIEVQAQIQHENIMTSLHRIILKANQVEFGKETFGRITQFIDVDISNQRYSLDAQLNDLMDDLFATVPTIERKNSAVLNKIHTTIERFKQLRQQFSTFDENGNILYETVKKAKWKPLSVYFEKFDTTLYWILPVVKNIKKIYLTEPTADESENIDIEIISEEPFQHMTEITQKYKSAVSSEEDNKYVTMCKELNPVLRPFEYTHHENQKDVIARKKVNTNLLTIVNNNDDYISYVSRGKGSTSEQGQLNVISETKYFTQQYNNDHIIGSKLITTKKAVMDADVLELKSIITFPEPIIRFSRINLPGSNVLIKSNLNKSFFRYWQFFSKKIAIQEKMAHEEQSETTVNPISWTKKLGINSNAEQMSMKMLVNNKLYAQAQLDEKTRQLTVARADLAEAESDLEKANPYTTRFEKKMNHEIKISKNKLTEKAEKLKQQIERAQTETSPTNQDKIDRLTRELAAVKANLLYTKQDLENAEYLTKEQTIAQETKVPYSADIKKRIQRSREIIKNNLKKKVDRLKQKVNTAYAKNVEAEEELAEAQANGDPLQVTATVAVEEEKDGMLELDQYEFAKKITNYKMKVNSRLSKEENYKKYIDNVIPNIKVIFQIMKKYINAKLSIVDVVSYLEPFLIYTDDLTYSQYKDITTYIDEEITKYNKSFTSKKGFFKENINKFDHANIITSDMLLMSLKIFKTPFLKHDVFKKYSENDKNAFFTNQEVLSHFVNSDFGNFYNTFYSKENIELMFPNDVTNLIENINKEFEKEEKVANDKSTCNNYIIAKKYYTIQELEDDNGKNIYFDRQFDDTHYGILDEYEKERSKMKPEEFFIFLQEKLKNKMKLDDAEAHYLTETLINGMRSVLDGHYAILIIITDYSYFIRKNNKWELAKNIDPKLISTNQNMLCNLQVSCISKENMCKNTSGSALAIKQEFIKKAIEEFDAKYAMSKDAFQKMLETKLKYYGRIVPKINEIEKERFYKYNNIKYNLGLNVADDSNIDVSPNASLLRHILGMNDVEKQQMYIIKFVKMFTEPRIDDPHWLYCKITHMKLIPYFLYTMATHYNSPNYQRHVDILKKTIGKLSDDGDAWVDKHSGYIIEKINFNIDESYEEGQQRIKTRDEMIGDALLSDALLNDAMMPEPSSSKPKLNKQSQLISNIVTTLSREMGVNIESERDFVINTVNTIIQDFLTKKSDYAKKMKEKANKGVIISSYESYYNETVLFATFATFLIAIQTSIPSIQTRKTFPGCVKSFVGYPFDGVSDFSSLTYISCVGYKLRSNVDPWSVLQKKRMEYVYDTTKRMIDTILLELPEIKRKIGEKVEYLLKKPEIIISEEYNLTKWKQFLPPLIEIHIREKDLQYISSDFEKALLKDLKTGVVYKQREKILVLESKVIQYSLAIQEKIQNIVKKQGLLLNSYLENACCMENKTAPMIDFFKQKDGSIETYNNNAINLSKIIKDINDLSTAVMLSSRINTKVIRPPILKIFSEGTIYLAFIYFCKFKIHAPINETYLSVCTLKPKIDEKDKDNNAEIIRKMKLSDYNYSSEHFLRLLQLVNQQNMVDINQHTLYYIHTLSGLHVPFPVIEPLDMLHNLMVFINTSEKDDGIELLIQLLKPEGSRSTSASSSSENSRSSSETKLGNYLNHHVSSMKTTILDYIKENSKEELTKKKMKNIERFLDSVMESKPESKLKSAMDLKLKSDRVKMKTGLDHLDELDRDMDKESKMDWKYSQLAFFKSYAREMSEGFPNIILNKMKYENSQEVQIPSYWKLSRNHVIEIQQFIYDYYSKLAEFIDDISLKNVLVEIKQSCDNLLLAINELYYFNTITNRTIDLLIQYLFFKIFIKYIELSNKKQEYKKPRNQDEDDLDQDEPEEDEDYELQERDDIVTISGEQKILKKKVAKLLIVYINIMTDDKKDNDISYDDISDLVFKMKQKEKNDLTKKLKLKSDEERAIDNLFKKYKLGDWNKGLQKGLTEYVAEDYDNALEERDANQQYENDLRNNARHGTNYDEGDDLEDNLEQIQIDREIEDDNADMRSLDEDFTDGRDPYFGNDDEDIGQTDEY